VGRAGRRSRGGRDHDDAVQRHDGHQCDGARLENHSGRGCAAPWHHAASLNDLLHGKINKFSLDTLTTLATRAGLKVKIDVRSAA
jgi:hypothetical protein